MINSIPRYFKQYLGYACIFHSAFASFLVYLPRKMWLLELKLLCWIVFFSKQPQRSLTNSEKLYNIILDLKINLTTSFASSKFSRLVADAKNPGFCLAKAALAIWYFPHRPALFQLFLAKWMNAPTVNAYLVLKSKKYVRPRESPTASYIFIFYSFCTDYII